jgi:accessory secretory protein Asp1
MLYFIPAWYQLNSFKELEQNWHTRRMHTEFDDTVKHVQMFYRNGINDFTILLLSHAPNFRHFLHRQGVFHAPYLSVFDAIQEVRSKKTVVFSFHNLAWPEDIEFVYTPFVVVAYLHGKKYAQIDFGEAGNPIEVSMYENDVISRRNIYDDRGFISATELYENGNIVYTDYLTEDGVVKMRMMEDTGEIRINEKVNTYLVFSQEGILEKHFEKYLYSNISQVILEVLKANLAEGVNDTFCIAMHELNVSITKDLVGDRKAILSFYGDRYRIKDHEEGKDLVRKADYIITDSEATTRYLKREMGEELENIIDISPYDSRMDFGISEQLTVQKILVPVDGLPKERFKALMINLAAYLTTNENAMVHIFTRNAQYDLPENLINSIADIIEEAGYDRRMAISENTSDDTAENEELETEGEEEEIPVRFFIEQCVDELSVSKCIREQRIMVDMRHNPDLYLQINCISNAIPQIVRRETQYMQNGYNGFVVKEFERIPIALDYFLGSLANWNQAKVYSYEISQKYTTKHLLEKWQTVQEALKASAE